MAFGSTPQDVNSIPIGSVYVPGTGFKALQGGKLFTDSSSNDSAPVRVEITPGSKATYTYSISATAPYATPTDWIVIRGSASTVVKILRVEISGAATAATNVVFTLKKHTIANTGGTSTNPAVVKHDSNDSASTALVLLYTVAPTIDATAAIVHPIRLNLPVPGAASGLVDRYIQDYGDGPYAPITLRGVAQEFALNFAGAAVPSGGVYDVCIIFSEE